jgi:rare lipoprotein A
LPPFGKIALSGIFGVDGLVSRFWRAAALLLCVAPVLAACATNTSGVKRAAFTSKEYGVAVSPRVTTAKYPPHGGGRYLASKPYVVKGKTYKPVEGPGYVERGKASWYGQDFHGRRTANGEIFGAYYLTAASPVLPVPSYARVTNLENGRSLLVRINDRGPYMSGRIVDLSYEAAKVLGYLENGSAEVEVRYVGPAPLNGDDSRMLMASIDRPSVVEEQGETRIALADTRSDGPTSRDPLSGGLVGDIMGLFGYADTNQTVNGAIDAANAMATRASALDAWKASVDDDARKVRIEIGTFADAALAVDIATAFALLGAVDEDTVTAGGRPATRLTLTHLKPGAVRADVEAMAVKLGLAEGVH